MGEAVRGEVLGDAVRGEVVAYSGGRCGRLPISASITRAARQRTCTPDVGREEGEAAAKCILHVGEAHSVISSTWL